jgi:aminopeptidase N
VRAGDEGRIHPGADDNASGIAVLLELATVLGRELQPERTLVFAAFTAEEWGLRGSRHYVETMERWPVARAMAMINLDTVGRLGDKKLTVFGTGTATEWVHIVRGIGFTTGIQADAVPDDPGGSDQGSFVAAGVPAVQIFSGAHEDYHRPSDSVDAIDTAGLVKVATFVREAVVYLGEREGPLTSTLSASAAPTPPSRSSSSRRVSLGTLPDFAFPGPGVKVTQVLPGTPAEAAGLEAGDLLVAIDDAEIADVRGYSNILRGHEPGDTIRLRVVRDGEEIVLEATLVAR